MSSHHIILYRDHHTLPYFIITFTRWRRKQTEHLSSWTSITYNHVIYLSIFFHVISFHILPYHVFPYTTISLPRLRRGRTERLCSAESETVSQYGCDPFKLRQASKTRTLSISENIFKLHASNGPTMWIKCHLKFRNSDPLLPRFNAQNIHCSLVFKMQIYNCW